MASKIAGEYRVHLTQIAQEKKQNLPIEAKRHLAELENKESSIACQCELLGLQRLSFIIKRNDFNHWLIRHQQ